ncbi:NAD-dependent succinate-semialdehyde dehydrogenase [Sphingopyxis lindanitolerans]|uniref:NAD-dependent succinate-semialdehyde dehydrogenase n=1 Tax=Sphingopyxis lindanitolerans TaxID=2054227 RepID=A0A2S8BAC0_9SPHN|nr:NAD-dependent succinate-semialdehyde dehydrogenase [Sphingopyxis lindanitolerans]PQM29362.1 NAD-dependent succinate-semialdehyde dehydrogenase [Sphingopyxis lindanitolerans]
MADGPDHAGRPFGAGEPSKLLIGGRWCSGSDGRRFTVEDPATGSARGEAVDASPADALAALDAAVAAQLDWARAAPRERAEILRRGFDLLTADRESFASIIAQETGKPPSEARGEVAYAAEFLRWFSEEAVRIHGRYQTAPDGKLRHLVSRKPVGPCLLVTPWNFPLAMVTRKVAPALAAGCTMVVKPSELTPATAARFAALMIKAGLPAGVLNLVPTMRAEAAISGLLADPRLRKLSFTGSTRVGRLLLAATAANVQRSSLELGGNAPFLVFADADLDAAIEGAMQAKLRNAGQACTAANRFLVHEAIADEFLSRLGRAFEAVTFGDREGAIGPLINRNARDHVHALVSDALARGARLVTGGSLPEGRGYFYPPTLLADVAPGSRLLEEEIFGPVAPVQRFACDAEAISAANSTPYGLAAYAYTADVDRALRLQDELDAGMLGINSGLVSDPAAPFGGVKHSGLGREGGTEGIEEYLSIHYAAIGRGNQRSRDAVLDPATAAA